jgi:uncharacterized Zn finger protein
VNPWDRPGWPRSAPKKPPPAHGIKMKKAGTTWWGQRWIEALERVLRGDSGRLARGRTYARAGRTHDLIVKAGKVTAKVTGSGSSPYTITIQLTQLPAATWQAAIAGMAAKAQFSAELLAGQMPRQIDDVFRAAATSLFPTERADLATTCSCPDWGDPCKHVAATHYVLGEALDRDPFLLFELRGRSKAQVLDALRAARGVKDAFKDPFDARGAPPAKRSRRAKTQSDALASQVEVARVSLGAIDAADYDRPREALPALQFSFDEPLTHGAVLRQLGTPPAWIADGSPADALGPVVRRAAEAARRIALADAQPQVTPDHDSDAQDTARSARGLAASTNKRGRTDRPAERRKRRKNPGTTGT